MRLRDAKRDGALDEQQRALEELRSAKAELEEILRQLREEEMKQLLATLEARFTLMLSIQREVYDGTKQLDAVPENERSHHHEIQASRLSTRENDIMIALEKVWVLLREDGTTLALPLAVEELRNDVTDVITRLAEAKVGSVTQVIEEGIIASLEDIVDSLKKAQQDLEDQQQQSQPSSGMPQDAPLVDMLAELKMIRSMQMRVNRRTEAYRKLSEESEQPEPELLDRLDQLAERQYRIQKVTRDIHMGRNQ